MTDVPITVELLGMKFYEQRYVDLPDMRSSFGWLTIQVLPELWGRRFDAAALGMIMGLRPRSVRVTRGSVTDDARRWRVTIWIEPLAAEHGVELIERIEQEVEVSLPRGIQNGHELRIAATHGRDSRQMRTWRERSKDGIVFFPLAVK